MSKISTIATKNFASRDIDGVRLKVGQETHLFRKVVMTADDGSPISEVCLLPMLTTTPHPANDQKVAMVLRLLQTGYDAQKQNLPKATPKIQPKAHINDYIRFDGEVSRIVKVDTSDFMPNYELANGRMVLDNEIKIDDILLESEV